MGCRGDGFGGDVELDVICIAVEVEAMALDDLTEGEEVENEEERTKHRPLRNTLGQGGSRGGAVVGEDELLSIGEVGVEPGEGIICDVEEEL